MPVQTFAESAFRSRLDADIALYESGEYQKAVDSLKTLLQVKIENELEKQKDDERENKARQNLHSKKRRVKPPVAPSSFAAAVLSQTMVRLEWADNSDNKESFVLERRTVGGGFLEHFLPYSD